MKKFTKLSVTLLIAIMAIMIAIPVFAENKYEGQTTPLKDISGTSFPFSKYLVMPAGASIPDPQVEFEFTIDRVDLSKNDGVVIVQGDPANDLMEIRNGIETPVISNSGKVVFTPNDTFDNDHKGVYDTTKSNYDKTTTTSVNHKVDVYREDRTNVKFEAGEKYFKKDLTIDFTGITFPEPGIYRYLIKETQPSANHVSGIIYDDTPERYLDVYVVDDNKVNSNSNPEQHNLKIEAYVMQYVESTINVTDDYGSIDENATYIHNGRRYNTQQDVFASTAANITPVTGKYYVDTTASNKIYAGTTTAQAPNFDDLKTQLGTNFKTETPYVTYNGKNYSYDVLAKELDPNFDPTTGNPTNQQAIAYALGATFDTVSGTWTVGSQTGLDIDGALAALNVAKGPNNVNIYVATKGTETKCFLDPDDALNYLGIIVTTGTIYLFDDGNGALYYNYLSDVLAKAGVTVLLSKKTDGFTNEYKVLDLAFKKEVKGNQGSRDKYFKFTLDLEGLQPGGKYIVSIAADNDPDTNDGNADASVAANVNKATTVNGSNVGTPIGTPPIYYITANDNSDPQTAGKYSQDFYLQHGQSIVIRSLPADAKYRVTEAEEDYLKEASAVKDYTEFVGDLQKTLNKADIDGDLIVKTSYLNTRDGIIPTGVITILAPAVALILLAVVGIAFVTISRRRREDSE